MVDPKRGGGRVAAPSPFEPLCISKHLCCAKLLIIKFVYQKKIIKIIATRCYILRLKCTKFNFGWGFAPDPLGELTALPQTL